MYFIIDLNASTLTIAMNDGSILIVVMKYV